MHTREGTREVVVAAQPRRSGLRTGLRYLTGFGHTTKVVGSAVAASLLLIAALAVVSMCWDIHPLLTIAAVAALAWVASRLAPVLLVSGRRTNGRQPH